MKNMLTKKKNKIDRKKQKNDLQKPNGYATRLATPFTMKCLSCSGYIYKNKRHNAVKETAIGEDYLGVESYRFYIKCTGCRASLTIRTDPKNGAYVAEKGCARVAEEEKTDDDPLECNISNQLRKESDMKDEIEKLRMQMGFVSSDSLSISDVNRLKNLRGKKQED